MVRVGFIGTGGIARAHAWGWKQTAEAGTGQVAALCDVDRQGMDAFERELGVEGLPRYDNWKTMLNEAELDAVDICLPHHLHAPAVLAAAAAKKHILIEKPLCTSLEEGQQISDSVEANGVTLMCAHNQLFEPAIRHMRGELDKGVVGEIQQVVSKDAFYTDRSREEWGWRADLATAGGGVLIDTGYHPTYRLLHMAGADPVRIAAMTHRYNLPIEGEDVAHVLVEFANQALGHLYTSWTHPLAPGGWHLEVYGSEGAVFGRGAKFLHTPYRGEPTERELEQVNGFVEEVKHFVDCVAHGKTPIQTHVDGVNVLKVILGAYQARDTGTTISC